MSSIVQRLKFIGNLSSIIDSIRLIMTYCGSVAGFRCGMSTFVRNVALDLELPSGFMERRGTSPPMKSAVFFSS